MGFLSWWHKTVEAAERDNRARAYKEAYTKAYTEAFEKGVQIGIDWVNRKTEAEAQGLPFDEPRPGSPEQLLSDQQIKRQC